MSAVVVDASAALAIVRHEPERAAVLADLRSARRDRLLVPELFWLEVVNTLIRRYAVAGPDVVEAIHELDELGIETIGMDRSLLLLALERTVEHGLTTYDAAYLALAEVEDAGLLTLDARLAAAADPRARPALEAGSIGTAGTSASYRRAGDSAAAWSGYGAHLAELRHKARPRISVGSG